MLPDQSYKTKSFNLHGLEGISDKTIDMHLSLYEGYVKATNAIQGESPSFSRTDRSTKRSSRPIRSSPAVWGSSSMGWCCTNITSKISRRTHQ